MNRPTVTFDVSGMPELIASLRKRMADLLRQAAESESADVKAFAERCAAAFEPGQ